MFSAIASVLPAVVTASASVVPSSKPSWVPKVPVHAKPVGDSFQKTTVTPPIQPNPKAGGRIIVPLNMQQADQFLQIGLEEAAAYRATAMADIMMAHPDAPQKWIGELINTVQTESHIQPLQLLDVAAMFRVFEVEKDNPMRLEMFKVLNLLKSASNYSAVTDTRINDFQKRFNTYFENNKETIQELLPDINDIPRFLHTQNNNTFIEYGFKNHFYPLLSGISQRYVTSLMGGEITPYLLDNDPYGRMQGFYVGLHPVEQLMATPERKAQIIELLKHSLQERTSSLEETNLFSQDALQKKIDELQFFKRLSVKFKEYASGLNSEKQEQYKMADSAMKDIVLQEVNPALHPEQLEEISTSKVPIDEWLLPTLESMFMQNVNISA
jgi:hypothetical protein